MGKLFLAVIIILSLITAISFGEEVNSARVNEYITKMGALFSKYPDPWNYGEGTIQFEEYKKILNSCSLSDSEYLEVQDILTRDYDVLEMCNKMQSKEISYDQDVWNKGLIFISTAEHLNQQWVGNNSSLENIIIDKISPILSTNKNPVVVRYWTIKSGDMLRDITNKKLSLSENNRNEFCDKLIEIIGKDDNPDNLRIKAIEAWSIGEKRNDKWIKNVDIIINNKKLFKNTAYYFYRGHRTPEEITNKMLNILENSDKYPQEIGDGVLDYLGRVSGSDDKVLVGKLKKAMNSKMGKERTNKNKDKYENILKSIEWHEKREIKQ